VSPEKSLFCGIAVKLQPNRQGPSIPRKKRRSEEGEKAENQKKIKQGAVSGRIHHPTQKKQLGEQWL